MLASTNTMVINGIQAQPVTVEVDLQDGLPGFDMVGFFPTLNIEILIC